MSISNHMVKIRTPLWQEVKEFAQANDMTVKDVITHAVEAYLASKKEEGAD